MIGSFFSLNGELKPVNEAVVSIDHLSFVYGFGVYENLKVRNGVLFFPELHVQRLLKSAAVIGVPVRYKEEEIIGFLRTFVSSVSEKSFNIKILLMGEKPDLYIIALAPKFLTDKDYR